MTEFKINQMQAEFVAEPEQLIAQDESVTAGQQILKVEEKVMFDLAPQVEGLVVYGDRSYRTEDDLKRFLATLTEAQLAQTEILLDDDTFVVFYPLLFRQHEPSGYHFDLDDPRQPITGLELPERAGVISDPSGAGAEVSREDVLTILLASVRL